jgi:hypothetical protein
MNTLYCLKEQRSECRQKVFVFDVTYQNRKNIPKFLGKNIPRGTMLETHAPNDHYANTK